MAERTPVTAASVRAYLDREMSGDNYHLMYGLHLLSRDRFVAVMDALMNGDLQIEELVRMGGFTNAEADLLLRETLGSWVSPAVAEPRTGEDGYAYLSDELGLGSLVTAAAQAAARTPVGRLLGASVRIGPGGHSGLDEVEAIFADRILEEALAGLPLAVYLPSSEVQVRALPIAAGDDEAREARASALWGLCRVTLAPLMEAGTVLERLVAVGRRRSRILSAPGLAEWVMSETRPAGDTRLLMHREAAERTMLGPFTRSDITAKLDAFFSAVPSFVATGRSMSALDFQVAVCRAAAARHFPDDAEIAERVSTASDALQALFDHRDRLRGFALRVLDGCARNLLGEYPPN